MLNFLFTVIDFGILPPFFDFDCVISLKTEIELRMILVGQVMSGVIAMVDELDVFSCDLLDLISDDAVVTVGQNVLLDCLIA